MEDYYQKLMVIQRAPRIISSINNPNIPQKSQNFITLIRTK